MERALWLLAGIGLGFIAAHYANRTEMGNRLFTNIDRGAKEFGEAVVQGYRSREAQFVQQQSDQPLPTTNL